MKTNNKYKLTDEFITLDNRKLYRIEALKDFYDVKKGDKGGFIESKKNLSQYDDCWIYNDAMVYDNAKVYDNARIFNNARIFMNANVFGNASVFGDAKLYGYSRICDKTKVYGNAQIFGNANLYDYAIACGNSKVFGYTAIFGYAKIEDANISNDSDYIVFKNWWSSARYFTWTRSNNMWRVGCFFGTGEELIAKAYKDSELSGKEYERVVKYVESIIKDTNKDSNIVTRVNKIKQCLTKFIEKFKL